MLKVHRSITINDVWRNLLNDIEHLFQFQAIRYSKWMLLYTYIFDYCTDDKHFDCADLYENFRNYLRNHLENLCQLILQNSDILECYIKQWNKYRTSSKILHGICSYLNRHYVQRKHNLGICEIYPMALQIWQQVVGRLLHSQITQLCLNMIQAERNHQKIDTEIIRNVIQTHITFDINEPAFVLDNNRQILGVYQEYFEDQFIQHTEEFYRLEVITYLREHSVIEYLLKIPQYIDEEIYRVTAYLHPSTINKLVKKLEEVLIHDQLKIIHVEAEILIRDENIQDLNLLFQRVTRVENGKIQLTNLMENHIRRIGIETIERINPISTNDLSIYIQTIYDLHQRCITFIQKTFDNDQEFIDALNRACRKFINDNAVGSTTNMAVYLARHCDKLLRKGGKEEIDLEMIMKQIKILLYYMQEKDVFEKCYSKLLAKRFVNQINTSIDNEKLMVSNIQDICGFPYVSKMKQMCQNIETSKIILNQYHQYCESEQLVNQINFSVMVLNSNVWSFSKLPNIILPNKLEFIVNHFNHFYNHLHNGRKLVWLYQHSKSEVQTFFTKKVYILQVSMYQMVILLLFNNSSELSVKRIHDETQIKIDVLIQILNILLRSKILTSTQIIDQANLDMDSTIELSNDFTSDKRRINLNSSMVSVEQNEAETCDKKIDQDRIMVIQATIVRIMKLHKTMSQNLLIQTVIPQLTSYFNPNISIIKDCIHTLIEKEYLERQSNNTDVLCYIT